MLTLRGAIGALNSRRGADVDAVELSALAWTSLCSGVQVEHHGKLMGESR